MVCKEIRRVKLGVKVLPCTAGPVERTIPGDKVNASRQGKRNKIVV